MISRAWRVAQAFETSVSPIQGCPILRALCEGWGSGMLHQEMHRLGAGSIVTRPCKIRKDGAPLCGGTTRQTFSKGGPPALHLGPIGAGVGIWNDPRKENIINTGLGIAAGPGGAIMGAFTDAFDYGINHSNGRTDSGANLIPTTVSNGEVSFPNPDLAPCGGMC